VIFTVLVVPLIVTVDVDLLKVPPLLSQLLGAVKATDPLSVNVPPLLTRTSPDVPVEVVEPTERSVLVIVSVPGAVIVSVVLTFIALLWVIVPVMVRFANPAVPFSFTVLVVPLRVTVDVPFVNVPALLSQFPEQVHAPLVKLRVVPVPAVTSRKVTVDVLAVRPPVPASERDDPPVMLIPLVVSVPEPEVASVLLTSRAFVLMVTVPAIVRL
jgi:hypothetical protein